MTTPPTDSADLRVLVASVPHRAEVVAEIWLGDEMLAEVRQDDGVERVQLFGRTSSAEPWDFGVDELLAVLERARRRLRGDAP
jgi:hypothetical protein